MLKRRALSLLLVFVMIVSLLPSAVLASGETDAIAIQERTITTSTTTLTVKVTGYEGLSNATLRLSVGPDGTESDWGMSNPPRTALGSLKYTGPDTYTFPIDPAKLAAGKNVQAYLYYWSDSRDDWAYIYGYPVEITDGDPVPSVSISTPNVTNRTTELSVMLKNLPASGIFRVIQLGAEETYDSARLNSYTSLYFSVVGNLHAAENALKLTAAPEAGSRLLAVLRDSSGSEAVDYTSQPVTVAYEQEPSIVSIVGEVDSASTTVKVSLTRVPSMGILKVIALDVGEEIPSNVFNFDYSGALYTGYFAAFGLHTGENTLTLSAAPAAGKLLYAVVRDSSVTPSADYVSEGVAVAQAYTPFAMYIKGELTNSSTTLSVFPKMKRYNAQPSVLESAALFRAGVQTPLAELEAPMMGELMTFTGLSGLTAGEKLTLTVTYDGGRTAAWEYLVCDAAEENSFEIVEKTFTTTSTTVTVKVSGYNWYNNREDWSRICITTGSASQIQPGDDEGREDLTSQVFTGKGTYTFTIPADKMDELTVGNSVMAALRFYDGHGVEGTVDFEWYAAADSVLISAASKTPLERLENCSVTMLKDGQPRTETFRQEQTSIDYAVTLDNEIPSAALGFYAYPGTVAFDPDGGHKISLGSVKVTQSGTGTIPVDLTNVPAGYRVIASLYVCIDGDEWYRHVNSAQTPEVVDENGKGFEPYVYPDATIDETELWAGDTSLHMSLTGDARFFEYAAQGKITINVALAQYPADEDFDFEGSDQISLGSAFRVTEAFSGREFTFADKPLREGYRVRAVVYWTQNADLFIAPGNDYEAVFNLPDDSVLVSGSAQSTPSVTAKPVTAGDTTVAFTVTGTVPEGAILLAKSYPAGTTEFLTTGGTPLGVVNPASAGDVTLPVSGDALTAGRIVVAFLLKDGAVQAQSQPVTVEAAPEKQKPSAYLLTQNVTAGMTKLAASMQFDSSIKYAEYKLYQFDGDTLNAETAEVLVSGGLYRSQTNQTLYVGVGRLKVGSKLQLVLTAGGEEARSAAVTVQPSPDWGTPYAAFSVSAVKSDAASVSLTVDYSDQYLTLGDEFYCDVTVYACSGEYSDDEIEDNELWENFRICRAVAKANSRMGGETRGELTLDFYDTAALQAGEKLFIKLRLPHVEWEGEEVDYVSASIPVIAADDEIPEYRVVLYNLESDTSRGARLRTILSQLNIPIMEITYENLNQSVGYLAGLEGYEAAASAYDGRDYDAEFMLICNLPESLLDRFLDAMQSDGLRIDHKAVVTAYNRDRLYYELMDEIADEHNVFQMLLKLNDLIVQSKKLTEAEYGASDHWDALQEAIAAGEALIRSEEPSYEDMLEAYERLKAEYLAVTGQTEIDGIAAITIAPEADGTYTMTASVLGGSAERRYVYAWSNGSSARTLTSIPAERLIGTTLTVTAAGCYGQLTAQLAVPAYTAPEVSADKNTVTVKLHPAEAVTNTPAAEQYIVMLYQGETLVETKTVPNAQSVVFSGLSEKTAYIVKSYAVSPVGRSDILTQAVTTAAGGSENPGDDESKTYAVTILRSRNGSVTANYSRAAAGDVVMLTVRPDRGYTLSSLMVLDSRGWQCSLTGKENGRYSFVMPSSDVTVEAAFKAESTIRRDPFTDVPDGAYYADAVLWAVDQKITTGVSASSFDPNGVCTRAEAVTFLWRAAGLPAPKSKAMPFTDVKAGSYYYDAVLWAVENGITNGTGETTFSPDAACTRAQIVTFLWRAQGAPNPGRCNPFADVAADAYYAEAVLWAVKAEVTNGTSNAAFSPDADCTRAQIVTFLWRALAA